MGLNHSRTNPKIIPTPDIYNLLQNQEQKKLANWSILCHASKRVAPTSSIRQSCTCTQVAKACHPLVCASLPSIVNDYNIVFFSSVMHGDPAHRMSPFQRATFSCTMKRVHFETKEVILNKKRKKEKKKLWVPGQLLLTSKVEKHRFNRL